MASSFDTRSHFLKEEIPDDWEPLARAQHWHIRLQVIEELRHQYGAMALENKVAEYSALGPEPFSVLSYHNHLYRQVRDAFVAGSYYPALTGCCALGERILNHLIQDLRDDFRGTPEYKHVYDKEGFDNWDLAIGVLESWSVILPEVVADFRTLRDLRNQSIHYRPEVGEDPRPMAIDSIKLLARIISNQFGSLGDQPWYLSGIPGEIYLKRDSEQLPFVRRFLIPSAVLVGPRHELEFDPQAQAFRVADMGDAGPREGTDEEFRDLRVDGRH